MEADSFLRTEVQPSLVGVAARVSEGEWRSACQTCLAQPGIGFQAQQVIRRGDPHDFDVSLLSGPLRRAGQCSVS